MNEDKININPFNFLLYYTMHQVKNSLTWYSYSDRLMSMTKESMSVNSVTRHILVDKPCTLINYQSIMVSSTLRISIKLYYAHKKDNK